jgi:hypothetical protein
MGKPPVMAGASVSETGCRSQADLVTAVVHIDLDPVFDAEHAVVTLGPRTPARLAELGNVVGPAVLHSAAAANQAGDVGVRELDEPAPKNACSPAVSGSRNNAGPESPSCCGDD